MEKERTFHIYIPSYRRADVCTTHKHIEYGTYIVRKSEEAAYKAQDLSPCDVLAVDDDLICGLIEVNEWIIQNTPKNVICILNNNIKKFNYKLNNT